MRTAISLPHKLFEAAELLAKRMKVSRREIYVRAIEAFVAKHAWTCVRMKLDAVYAVESSTLDQSVVAAQEESISRERW